MRATRAGRLIAFIVQYKVQSTVAGTVLFSAVLFVFKMAFIYDTLPREEEYFLYCYAKNAFVYLYQCATEKSLGNNAC